ncbi:MAG: hypothetical protein ABIG84_08465, partial [archaeon]
LSKDEQYTQYCSELDELAKRFDDIVSGMPKEITVNGGHVKIGDINKTGLGPDSIYTTLRTEFELPYSFNDYEKISDLINAGFSENNIQRIKLDFSDINITIGVERPYSHEKSRYTIILDSPNNFDENEVNETFLNIFHKNTNEINV